MLPPQPLRPLTEADRRVAAWLFAAFACLYGLTSGGHFYASDAWQKFLALKAMVFHGTVFFPEGWTPGLHGACSFYPPGGSLLMLPGFLVGFAAAPLFPAVPPDFVARFFITLQNAFLTAGLLAVTFLLLRRLATPVGGSLFAVAALGLGSYLWPYSKTCWSEPGTALALFAALYLLRDASDRRFASLGRVALAGVLLSVAIMTRLEVSLVAPAALAWLLWRHHDQPGRLGQALGLLALPVAGAVLATLWYNVARYGKPLIFSNWQAVQSVTVFPAGGRPAWALNNLWHYTLNPSDGLLWFSPVILLGLLGLPHFWRKHPADAALLAGAFGPLAIFYVGFWGLSDWAWGLRYGYVFVPFLLLPAASLWEARPRWRGLWLGLFAGGLAVQLLAIMFNFGYLYEREQGRYPGLTIQRLMAEPAHAPLVLAWNDAPRTLAGGLALLTAPPPAVMPSVPEVRARSQFVPDFWLLLQLLTTIPRWIVAGVAAALLAALAYALRQLVRWVPRAAAEDPHSCLES